MWQLHKHTHLPTQAHVCYQNSKDRPQDWGRYNWRRGITSVRDWHGEVELGRRRRKDTQFFSRKTLFFPTSPVNIPSVSRLVDHLDDDKGTSIQTRRHYSILRWKNDSNQVRIEHSNHKLPGLAVNTGFSLFTTFCRALGSKINDKILHCHCSLSKKLPTLGINNKTDFNDDIYMA